MVGEVWTDEENDMIIADYFAMLFEELSERPINKAKHNRNLQSAIGRSRGAIEWKHQNISAVLIGLGEARITGYKPAFNFQEPLVEAVARWLVKNPAWNSRKRRPEEFRQMRETAQLWIDPPPTMRNAPPPDELNQMMAIARKFDVAGRDERNRALGRAGEERVLLHERSHLVAAGRSDLAERVRWISEEDGDGAGYDIASFSIEGRNRLIEVKTTNGWERTPFHISRNELAVADAQRADWCLLRVWDFSRNPRAFEIRPPLDAHVTLTPTSFQASFH